MLLRTGCYVNSDADRAVLRLASAPKPNFKSLLRRVDFKSIVALALDSFFFASMA